MRRTQHQTKKLQQANQPPTHNEKDKHQAMTVNQSKSHNQPK